MSRTDEAKARTSEAAAMTEQTGWICETCGWKGPRPCVFDDVPLCPKCEGYADEVAMTDKPEVTVTDEDRQAASDILWDWAAKTPGDQVPCSRKEGEVLTSLIARALAQERARVEGAMRAEIAELSASYAGLEAEIKVWKEENTALAADQCHNGYAGEHGHHRCRYQDRIAEIEAENANLRGRLVLHRGAIRQTTGGAL